MSFLIEDGELPAPRSSRFRVTPVAPPAPAAAGSLGSRYETLEIEEAADAVMVARINRPEVRNAISTQTGRDLLDVFSGLGAEPDPWRCVVLTGAGDKAFCAGVDLKERRGMSDAQWHAQHQLFERMMLAVLDCPLPVIAAVNGAAYAGGCELVLLADFAYAAPSARFALTEVTIGIMPGGGGTQTLPRRIGHARAAETILTGRPFSADEALSFGLINRICPSDALMAESIETATAISQNAPLSVRQAKRSMLHGAQMDLRSAMVFEVDAYNRLVPVEDRREGINAFNEKRRPQFRGR
jgi:enoyl-CoA hydratase